MKPYKLFATGVEHQALKQFFNAMAQDFVVKGALMPDAHTGYTMPIGGVVACKDVIVPSYVGYDIGCGLCAYKTAFHLEDILHCGLDIYHQIKRDLPVGFNKHKNNVIDMDADLGRDVYHACCNVNEDFSNAAKQLGTLGGGNHFVEIGVDGEKNIWIIIHSGSRHFGHTVASHHMKIASESDKAMEGHFELDVNSQNGKSYIADMSVALDYALANRKAMVGIVYDAIAKTLKGGHWDDGIQWDRLINRNHNHAELKNGLWIHRKGATHAEKDMYGVIPGNMRDGSFIVRGLGNEESLCSSSHGAGRVLSRTKAKKQLSMDEFEEAMSGIVAGVHKGALDESPMAYKDIFEVMELQKDLVEVEARVVPIINVKG